MPLKLVIYGHFNNSGQIPLLLGNTANTNCHPQPSKD